MGSGVHTLSHPMDRDEKRQGLETAYPLPIGAKVKKT
jgi:hypothetical protein